MTTKGYCHWLFSAFKRSIFTTRHLSRPMTTGISWFTIFGMTWDSLCMVCHDEEMGDCPRGGFWTAASTSALSIAAMLLALVIK
jgi:hypothetical protein